MKPFVKQHQKLAVRNFFAYLHKNVFTYRELLDQDEYPFQALMKRDRHFFKNKS